MVWWAMFALLHMDAEASGALFLVASLNPLHPLFVGVMSGQGHRRLVAPLRLIREGSWDRWHRCGAVGHLHVGRERRGLLDQALIKLDPFGLIERDGSHRLPVFAIDRDKAGLGR